MKARFLKKEKKRTGCSSCGIQSGQLEGLCVWGYKFMKNASFTESYDEVNIEGDIAEGEAWD